LVGFSTLAVAHHLARQTSHRARGGEGTELPRAPHGHDQRRDFFQIHQFSLYFDVGTLPSQVFASHGCNNLLVAIYVRKSVTKKKGRNAGNTERKHAKKSSWRNKSKKKPTCQCGRGLATRKNLKKARPHHCKPNHLIRFRFTEFKLVAYVDVHINFEYEQIMLLYSVFSFAIFKLLFGGSGKAKVIIRRATIRDSLLGPK